MEEVYVPVRDFAKYEVSCWGNVRNVKTGRILKFGPDRTGYHQVKLYKPDTKQNTKVHRLVAMHFVANPDGKPCVDHIDGDILNNHVSNLRWVTQQENCMNQCSTRGSSSRHRGVYWDKATSKWRATIRLDGRLKNLGRFNDEEEAAHAYDAAARELFREYARLNFP